jgi:hypothetical protein
LDVVGWVRSTARTTDPIFRVLSTIVGIILAGLIVGAALLARRNLRLGRGDRKGAKRLAILMFTLLCASFVVGARHFSALGEEMSSVPIAVALGLLQGGLVLLTAIYSGDSRGWFETLAMILLTGAIVGALVAFGVLATVTMLATNLFLELLPAGLGASAWYSPSSIAAVVIVAAVACAAFYVSRGYQRGAVSAAR